MKINGNQHRAVNWDYIKQCPNWINQCLLPFELVWRQSESAEEVALAIETMEVRGAPSIGAFAAYGLALAYKNDADAFESHWIPRFRKTRPTAVNLFHACDAMLQHANETGANADQMITAACDYADQEVLRNKTMGEFLAEKLAVGERRILTHCNAGWLAAVDWGTATSGIYQLQHNGESPFVWVDETRPRLQGARLTAWELMQEGVDCCLQADVAAAWMMAQGKVDAIVTGADRIAANGDTANKIGTYALSLAAREHGIPFYVAAPLSTFDHQCPNGQQIPIESRDQREVTHVYGQQEDGSTLDLSIATPNVKANNPAFDVTPFENITAIISEAGIWGAE